MVAVKIESSPATPSTRTNQASLKPSKKKPGFSNTSQLVTLIANEHETSFVIHKDFACFYSPTLHAAFNSTLIEGKTQTYRFRNATAVTIQFLVHWIYNQDFLVDSDSPELTSNKLLGYWRFRALVRLWIVAAELKIPRLQNEIIKELESLRKLYGCHGTRLFPFVYEQTQKGNPLRKYMAHAAINLTSKFVEDNIGAFPKDMLHDMAVLFMADKECREKVMMPLEVERNITQYFVPEE